VDCGHAWGNWEGLICRDLDGCILLNPNLGLMLTEIEVDGCVSLGMICVIYHGYFLTWQNGWVLCVGWTMVCGGHKGLNIVKLEYELRCLIYYKEWVFG